MVEAEIESFVCKSGSVATATFPPGIMQMQFALQRAEGGRAADVIQITAYEQRQTVTTVQTVTEQFRLNGTLFIAMAQIAPQASASAQLTMLLIAFEMAGGKFEHLSMEVNIHYINVILTQLSDIADGIATEDVGLQIVIIALISHGYVIGIEFAKLLVESLVGTLEPRFGQYDEVGILLFEEA